MKVVVGVAVYTKQDPQGSFLVESRHYEWLRDALDKGETGWIELDSSFGDGKVFLRLEDIVAMVHHTASMVEAVNTFHAMADG